MSTIHWYASEMDRASQAQFVGGLGASDAEVEELLVYCENRFGAADPALIGRGSPPTGLSEGPLPDEPLPDEPFVACWRAWVTEATTAGALTVLGRNLPQLWFPIQSGISQGESYRAATLRGASAAELDEAGGLELTHPHQIELHLHASFAGGIPLIVARHRADFVRLLQALARRNEPAEVPDAQGAVTVAGYNNWARIHALRAAWQAEDPANREAPTWGQAFARIQRDKSAYQDRFILLSDGPYSGVPSDALGLDAATWRRQSLVIRREHECAHYYTRRVYGLMRNNLLDELIADHVGLVVATGTYQAAWFLRFMGLEDESGYRAGGRLDLYRGDPALSDGAFHVLGLVVRRASRNLEAWFEGDDEVAGSRRDQLARTIRALAACGLLPLAAPEGAEGLRQAWAAV